MSPRKFRGFFGSQTTIKALQLHDFFNKPNYYSKRAFVVGLLSVICSFEVNKLLDER